ncbi:MAG: PEP-CTERM sorting domain-containing protein [Phycisphaerae bacterium]|nr:PEP-CTERM sorting domain-containing protein [Phycisphaerae bacterium]
MKKMLLICFIVLAITCVIFAETTVKDAAHSNDFDKTMNAFDIAKHYRSTSNASAAPDLNMDEIDIMAYDNFIMSNSADLMSAKKVDGAVTNFEIAMERSPSIYLANKAPVTDSFNNITCADNAAVHKSAIPEPATIALLALGSLTLRRKRCKIVA